MAAPASLAHEAVKAQASAISDTCHACTGADRCLIVSEISQGALANDDGSYHAGMDGAGVAIGPGLVETEREAVVGIQGRGAK